MFDPSKFTTPSAKPLPVVLLLDVSSSMDGEKIEGMVDTLPKKVKLKLYFKNTHKFYELAQQNNKVSHALNLSMAYLYIYKNV